MSILLREARRNHIRQLIKLLNTDVPAKIRQSVDIPSATLSLEDRTGAMGQGGGDAVTTDSLETRSPETHAIDRSCSDILTPVPRTSDTSTLTNRDLLTDDGAVPKDTTSDTTGDEGPPRVGGLSTPSHTLQQHDIISSSFTGDSTGSLPCIPVDDCVERVSVFEPTPEPAVVALSQTINSRLEAPDINSSDSPFLSQLTQHIPPNQLPSYPMPPASPTGTSRDLSQDCLLQTLPRILASIDRSISSIIDSAFKRFDRHLSASAVPPPASDPPRRWRRPLKDLEEWQIPGAKKTIWKGDDWYWDWDEEVATEDSESKGGKGEKTEEKEEKEEEMGWRDVWREHYTTDLDGRGRGEDERRRGRGGSKLRWGYVPEDWEEEEAREETEEAEEVSWWDDEEEEEEGGEVIAPAG